MNHRKPAISLAILVTLAVLALAISGCGTAPATAPSADRLIEGSEFRSSSPLAAGFDPGDGPSTPGGPPRVTLDALWPNDDGHFWRYRLNRVVTEVPSFHPYDTETAVPPAPSALELAQWLQRHRHDGPVGVGLASGTWTLRFEGRGTTLSGATGQNLTETLVPDAAARRPSAASSKKAFLSMLSRARPDLALRLRERSPQIEGASVDLYPPILIHGYIWEKTAEHIGTYGDVDLNLAWKFLEADISPGHEFTFQLVPSLADDVFLHALVLPPRYQTHPRLVPGEVEVLYVIDFGVSFGTDESGNIVGYFRFYSYGTVTYLPGVGPVAGVEYNGAQAGGSPGELHFDLKSFKLLESGPGTVVSDASDLVSARR